jgi:hypothetical protein
MNEKLEDLKKEVEYKWKPQVCGEYGTVMVAYVDARQCQDLLDDVCGQSGWQSRYEVINSNLFCGIGIKNENEWIWKYDCGIESSMEKEKGEASDAFKRACVQWGIGRFLYSLGTVKIPSANYKSKKNSSGQLVYYPSKIKGDEQSIFWDKDELNNHCFNIKKSVIQAEKTVINEIKPNLLNKKGEKAKLVASEAFDKFIKKHGDFLADCDGLSEFSKKMFWEEIGEIDIDLTSIDAIPIILERVKPEKVVCSIKF